jgi:hypothetical protein
MRLEEMPPSTSSLLFEMGCREPSPSEKVGPVSIHIFHPKAAQSLFDLIRALRSTHLPAERRLGRARDLDSPTQVAPILEQME